jgi:phosphoserine phosphatase
MKEIVIINVTGTDKPGLTYAITKVLAKRNINILDIRQSVIHDTLSLGLLIELPDKSKTAPILKDILFTGHELGLKVKFIPISEENYSSWVNEQGKTRNIITLLAKKITANQIAAISDIVQQNQLNIDNITRVSGRLELNQPAVSKSNACVEFSIRGNPLNQRKMKQDLLKAASKHDVDIAFQEDNIFRCNRRLVAFDMDSTLIKTEVIDELAKANGVEDAVIEITEKAMQGEIDFNKSLIERVKLLSGLDESVLHDIAKNLPLSEGAKELITTLKQLGFTTAILSGGFNFFGQYLKDKLGIDYVYANNLEIIDGKVTGNVNGDIVNGQKKAELLQEIATLENINLEQVIAVGDGANDLPMLSIAGLGIAFKAKNIVKKNAEHSISASGLDSILYLIGYREWYNQNKEK